MVFRELRIGNLVDLYGSIATIQRSDFGHNNSGIAIVSGKPISLTKEWFIKLGFKELNNAYSYYINKDLYLVLNNNEFFMVSKEYEDNEHPFLYHPEVAHKLNIKHIHQLQNLYFALTGEELTIK